MPKAEVLSPTATRCRLQQIGKKKNPCLCSLVVLRFLALHAAKASKLPMAGRRGALDHDSADSQERPRERQLRPIGLTRSHWTPLTMSSALGSRQLRWECERIFTAPLNHASCRRGLIAFEIPDRQPFSSSDLSCAPTSTDSWRGRTVCTSFLVTCFLFRLGKQPWPRTQANATQSLATDCVGLDGAIVGLISLGLQTTGRAASYLSASVPSGRAYETS